ncbi:HNH endonuclease [Photobacterium sanguinicancri]|uniref:HNH endonuclease n=1 Tax=Photobacterium sanguinicancri TaxID=875932 RepID=UPI002480EC41|nr:HNH endonuclease [Photobacterium sanguinicancri]
MNEGWSDKELNETVAVYLEMYTQQQHKQKFNKKSYYRNLSELFGRSEKAYEYRMQNISYIFTLLGRDWVTGLKPAKNVGRRIGEKIEICLAELEKRPISESIGFDIEVEEYQRKKVIKRPEGTGEPKAKYSNVVLYERSAQVKAWVLRRASGLCELCKSDAPFITTCGQPYLEVHHVKRLSDGGSDTIKNCVAVCPNCHRLLHYSVGKEEAIESLYQNVNELVRE